MDLVPVARILKPRGVRGQVWLERLREDAPALQAGDEVRVGPPESGRSLRVEECFEYAKGVVLKLEGVDRMEAAQELSGLEVAAEAPGLPEEGPFLFDTSEVVGFALRDVSRGLLGRVTEVREGPAYWIFVVEGRKGDFQVPAVKGLGVSVDRERGEVLADLPPGYPDVDGQEP